MSRAVPEAETLTQERLREVLDCDPETGLLHWRVSLRRGTAGKIAGQRNDQGYILVKIDGVSYRAHRLMWFCVYGKWPPADVDHINGDKADNRLCNLREATRSQNLRNSKKRSGTANTLKGASYDKRRGLWASRFSEGKTMHHLGYFATEQEAHDAFVMRAKEVFGEFARAA